MKYDEVRAKRSDYGILFEVCVSWLYHSFHSEKMSMVDGGANAGLHAVPMAHLVDGVDSFLYAYEPLPEIMAGLKRNLDSEVLGHRTLLFQNALSDATGQLEFVSDINQPALSRLKREAENLDMARSPNLKTLVVQSSTLDIDVRQEIDFIKLDLEGAEFVALKGARNLVERCKPMIVFENGRAWPSKLYGYSCADFFAYFNSFGYRVIDIHGTELTADTWEDPSIGFEFVACLEKRLPAVKQAIKNFWDAAMSFPVQSDWKECVRLCRKPELIFSNERPS